MTATDEKTAEYDGTVYRYSTDWIHRLESETHWRLYWRQQRLMEGAVRRGEHVLEIGVGSGFTANYLRSRGVRVTTLDIDAGKRPDIVANVAAYDFPDAYDHVLAFEVFEHIPFEEVERVLPRVARACRRCLFLSVPRCERVWGWIEVRLPRIGRRAVRLVTRRGRIREPHHFWEVDHGAVTIGRLERTFAASGFDVAGRDKAFSRLFYRLSSGGAGERNEHREAAAPDGSGGRPRG